MSLVSRVKLSRGTMSSPRSTCACNLSMNPLLHAFIDSNMFFICDVVKTAPMAARATRASKPKSESMFCCRVVMFVVRHRESLLYLSPFKYHLHLKADKYCNLTC